MKMKCGREAGMLGSMLGNFVNNSFRYNTGYVAEIGSTNVNAMKYV